MSDLASCYFCGTALDAPVETAPVVPDDLRADVDTGTTVALCPSCRHKLTDTLEVVFEATGDPSTDATGTAAGGAPGEADWGSPGDPGDTGSDPGEGGADSGGGVSAREDTTDERGASDSVLDAEIAEDESLLYPLDDEDESEAETGDGSDTPATDGSDDPPEGDADTAQDAHGDDPRSDDDGSSGQGSVLSTPAGNKIVRLLQNREFPVDRNDFEIIATNAYEIPAGECAEVIDALVTEGYLEQEGDQLVRPDGR